MAVVIAGCGDLGTEIGLRFAALGHRVLGLRRSASKLPHEIEGYSIDLSAEMPSLPTDTSIVVIAIAPDDRNRDAYQAVYVDSVSRVLTAIHRDCAAAPRVLFVSSTAVYGVDDGRWVDEATPTTPTTSTAVVLREAEEALREQHPGATIVRLGGIYGPGRNREIDRVRDGLAIVPTEARFTNRIHRDDAAAAIVHLMTMQDKPKDVYVGVDDCPVPYQKVIRFLARSLHVPLPVNASDPPRSRKVTGKRCCNSRLRESGFDFSYPTYREGYAAVLEGNGVRHP